MTTTTFEEPTRRAVLNMAIAAPVAGMIHMGLNSGGTGSTAAAILDGADTPILTLFRQWQYWNHEENRQYLEAGDEAADVASENRQRVEEELMALPCQDARDFIAKIVAYTDHGSFAPQDRQDNPDLWSDAIRLIG